MGRANIPSEPGVLVTNSYLVRRQESPFPDGESLSGRRYVSLPVLKLLTAGETLQPNDGP
jgi:hypothetical protein